jgi:hypothetical protein
MKQRKLKIREPETEKPRRLADELDEIALHCSRLPVLDSRTPSEILGYELSRKPPLLHDEEPRRQRN